MKNDYFIKKIKVETILCIFFFIIIYFFLFIIGDTFFIKNYSDFNLEKYYYKYNSTFKFFLRLLTICLSADLIKETYSVIELSTDIDGNILKNEEMIARYLLNI